MEKVKIVSLQIKPHQSIREIMKKLNETMEKILFVVNDKDQLIGTITDGDIRRGIINGLPFSSPVKDIMHKKYLCVRNNIKDIDSFVKNIMIENKVEHVPVVDENNVLVDVLRWSDMLEEGANKPSIRVKSLPNIIVIMAGGKGARLAPFTEILPKPLIPIGSKPVIEIIMDKFYNCGFSRYIYTLNYKKEYIKLFLKECKAKFKISWVEEKEFLGTAGALTLIKDKLKDTFFVTNCDSILDIDLEKALQWHKEQNSALTIIGCHNEVKIPFGVVEISRGRLKKLHEKPVHDVIINTGVYIIEPRALKYMKTGQRIEMTELIERVSAKENVCVYPLYAGWFDVGQFEEYKKSIEKMSGLTNV